jgi:acyl-CoA thioester hydrolase
MSVPHELLLRVRYSETDQMRVVHHASYLVYMEEGRTALMRSLGFPYEEVEERGLAMAVRRVEVRFRVAARYGDQVRVRTRVERFRGASILYGYEIVRDGDGELLASGSAEVACLDLAGGFRPVPIPDDIRAALQRYLTG